MQLSFFIFDNSALQLKKKKERKPGNEVNGNSFVLKEKGKLFDEW